MNTEIFTFFSKIKKKIDVLIQNVLRALSDPMYEIKLVRACTVLRLNRKYKIWNAYNMLTLNY